MDLLDFARGPALLWSLVILVLGVAWRLAGVLLQKRRPDYSEPRSTAVAAGAIGTIFRRMWPRKEFQARTAYSTTLSYVFHIGLAIVVFGFVPHILFVRNLTGLSWSGLPSGFIYAAGVVTLVALVAALVRRLTHPVLKLLSNFDDYFSWFVTAAPVVTGLMAVAHFGARYETILAVHILTVELLFVWFPFGKLMHAVLFAVSRGTTGALFARKGAAT
ncbi:MAG TPA: nitrate reductase [Burkholderiales bacterium]|nr:nitrate reductase [Burkholderiales bacterium]